MEWLLSLDPGAVLFAIFLILLAIGTPIAIALASAAIFVIWAWQMGIEILSYNFYAGIAKFPLLAIPFFILAGVIMERAGIAERIIKFIEMLIGNVTGGLAIVTIAVAMFWGAVSGSGPATVAALGVILIPAMVAAGYGRAFAAAVVSSSSGLAIIIPPSIAFIIYGVLASKSISALFAAGIFPGIIVGLFLMLAAYIVSKKRGYRGEEIKRTPAEVWKAFKDAFWGLLAPVIILGGIYGGIFTPTEAAAVAVFYGLFVGFFIYKKLTFKDLIKLLVDSTVSSSVVMIVVTFAGLFSWAGITAGVMEKATSFILSLTKNPYLVLILINILLLIAGMFLDAISIYYVFLPMFWPILEHFGWDPIWFGVVMTVNLAIGQITPPVAVNIYVGANISKTSLEDISREVVPFVLAAIAALLVISYCPSISTWLPKLLKLY